jgi:hypothetical protein
MRLKTFAVIDFTNRLFFESLNHFAIFVMLKQSNEQRKSQAEF